MLELYIENYAKQFARLRRPFWNYEDGCVLIALESMYHATGKSMYWNAAKSFIEPYIGSDGSISYYSEKEYNLDHIPSGRILFSLYEQTGEIRYHLAAAHLMKQLRHQPRLDCNSFWHKKIYPYQLWLDGLYMAAPFYLKYEKTWNEGKNYDDIMLQFSNARAHLYDTKTKLYYHAWDEKRQQFWANKETGRSPNIWSRAIGWFLMALADCYELFPEEEIENRAYLKGIWKEALDGMLQYQNQKSGLFYQLPLLCHLPGNYLETSASAMVAYSILKGCRLGVLSETYLPIGALIISGLENESISINEGQLHLNGICAGAGLGPDTRRERDGSVAYYLSEPMVSDEQKGVAAVMLAYSEWIRVRNRAFDWEKVLPVKLNDVRILRHIKKEAR